MGFFAVASRELQKIKANPAILIIILALPLFLTFLVFQTFKLGIPTNLPIVVMDYDKSSISKQLVTEFSLTRTIEVKYQPNDIIDAKKLLADLKAYALVVIPAEFEKDIFNSRVPKVILYYNNQTLLISGAIVGDITTVVKTFMVKSNILKKLKGGESYQKAIQSTNLVKVVNSPIFNPKVNYFDFIAIASFAHILQMVIIFTSIWSFGTEFKFGKTHELIKTAGGSVFNAVLGKMSVYFSIFSAFLLFVFFVYFKIYNAPLNGSFLLIVLSSAFYIFSYLAIGAAIVTMTVNYRLSLSLATFYTGMAFAFAGVTYPITQMPMIAHFYSQLLPMTHYVSILLGQSLKGRPLEYELYSLVALVALSFLPFLLIKKLKNNLKNEKLWGKS